MLRNCLCAAVALVLVGGVSLAEEKEAKKGKLIVGTFESYEKGVLKVKVKKGDETTTQEIKIPKETKFTVFDGDDKTELTGKDVKKIADTKEGTPVVVRMDEDDKVVQVRIGKRPKKTKEDK